MWTWFKRLTKAFYDHTVGSVWRLAQHIRAGHIDLQDKQVIGRLITYSVFGVTVWWFPAFAVMALGLRIMVMGDIINTIATIFQDTVNAT